MCCLSEHNSEPITPLTGQEIPCKVDSGCLFTIASSEKHALESPILRVKKFPLAFTFFLGYSNFSILIFLGARLAYSAYLPRSDENENFRMLIS